MNRPEQTIAICIGCGCDDDHACDDGPGPCYWLKVDRQRGIGVCSSCPDDLTRWNEGNRYLSSKAAKAASVRIQAEGAAEHRRRHASRQQ